MNDKQKAEHYACLIKNMQGHIFFIQNADGCLARWIPPQPIDEDIAKGGE